jgi:hypothetical protein
MKSGEYAIQMAQNQALMTTLRLAADSDLLNYVYVKQWNLEISTEGRFITSDAPVSFWAETPGPFGSVGIATADEMVFPLDPKKSLVLRHPDRESLGDVEADGNRVREINARTRSGAFKFIYERQTG